jgi:hypothetical protein
VGCIGISFSVAFGIFDLRQLFFRNGAEPGGLHGLVPVIRQKSIS